MKNILRKRRWVWGIGITLFIVLSAASAMLWSQRHSIERAIEKSTLPQAVEYIPSPTPPVKAPTRQPAASLTLTSPTSAPRPSIPPEANLAVPFTAQAPHANWDDPYGEFCEEASVLMAISYVRHQDIPDANFADKALLAIKAFEEKRFGFYQDTTVEQTAVIFREYYNYNQVQLLKDPTVTDIKQAIAEGKPVLVPAAGRMLGNPFFQSPGPLYHMLVIKGYTAAGKFIVNDPGTRRGADFLYDEAVIMNAMHDWRTDKHIEAGQKIILVVG